MLAFLMGGAPTYTGVRVDEESALRYGAVYACVRIISESIAALPLVLMRQRGRARERATAHPLYGLLHNMPNPEMTSFEWRELSLSHLLLWGNALSEKELDGNTGRTVALWPLNPAKVEKIERTAEGVQYVYRESDETLRTIPGFRVHHVKGPGDGSWGHSPIGVVARQAVALGLATEEFGARFFGNGARPGGVLETPGKLSQTAIERLQTSFATEHGGLANSHRVKVLEEGLQYKSVGIPPEEAQFLETRKFQVTEIARIYRVPPHMLADLDRATFSNIEHQSLNFVQHTLMPWIVRHEQAIYRDLLTERERKDYFAKYVVAGMLRGDQAARAQAYSMGINTGYYTRNEVRELEDLNPLEGLDEPLVPLNMVEVGQEPLAPPSGPTAAPRALPEPAFTEIRGQIEERAKGDKQRRIMNRHVRLFEDAAGRAVKREIADIRKALPKHLGKRSAESFEKWLAGFYEQVREWLPDYFRPLMLAYAETMLAAVADELGGEPAPLDDELRTWVEGYLTNFVEVYAVGGEKQLRTLLLDAEDEEEAAAVIEERMTGWEENRAQKTALEQAFEAGNALAIYGYAAGGVTHLVWRARGESCPFCRKMDGRRIPIKGQFFDEGDTVTAEGVEPLPIVRKIRHGPLHSGCDCVCVAG